MEDSQTTIRRRPYIQSHTDHMTNSTILSTRDLLLGASPYAFLDDARFAAFSPSAKATFSSLKAARSSIQAMLSVLPDGIPPPLPSPPIEKRIDTSDHAVMKALASLEGLPPLSPTAPQPQASQAVARMQQLAAAMATFKSRLPNTTLQVDLRTLNLHLALRTSEILACAEALWEWVLDFQAGKLKQKEVGRSRSGSIDGSSSTLQPRNGHATDPVKEAIAELSRSDFDALLINFNL